MIELIVGLVLGAFAYRRFDRYMSRGDETIGKPPNWLRR